MNEQVQNLPTLIGNFAELIENGTFYIVGAETVPGTIGAETVWSLRFYLESPTMSDVLGLTVEVPDIEPYRTYLYQYLYGMSQSQSSSE